jgi:hypothetical protein
MITNLDQTIARFIQLIPTDLLPKGKIYQGITRLVRRGNLNWDPWILKESEAYYLFYLVGRKRCVSLVVKWEDLQCYFHGYEDMEEPRNCA